MSETSNASQTSNTLHPQLQQPPPTQQLLLEITQRIASSGTLDDLLHAIRGAAQRGLNADGACIVLGSSRAEAGYAIGGDLSATLGLAGPALLAQVAKSGALEVPDTATNRDLDKLALSDVKALIVMPLLAHDAQQGIIAVGYKQPHPFSDDERIFLSIVAGQTAVAVENAHAYDVVNHSQEQLAAILASTTDPVIVVDAQNTIVLLNPAAERALNIQPQTAIGKPFDEAIHAEALHDLLKDPAPKDALEWQSEAGQTYAPHISEINVDDSRRRGRVLVLRDITRYKTLHANQTEFLSTISHDLRSPLTYMQGWATMLPMFGELTAKQKDAADKIVGGIAQMTDLIEKILDAGRLDRDTGYYELMREPCDVSKMANDVVATHQPAAEKKGQKLVSDIDQHLPILNLDDVMLRRALNNLVDNAVKYTPDNGLITVGAHMNDGVLLLSVKDTGRGISEEHQKRLFDKFVRVRTKDTQRIKGSGLGLFIVRSIAQKHNGDAWIKSKEGEGSTFFISIPAEGANLLGAESKAEKKTS